VARSRRHRHRPTNEPSVRDTGKVSMHKFKIGETVNYRPSTRTTRNVAGTFKVIAFLPEGFGEPVYRIQHIDTDYRQIARESEVTKRY